VRGEQDEVRFIDEQAEDGGLLGVATMATIPLFDQCKITGFGGKHPRKLLWHLRKPEKPLTQTGKLE